MNTASAASTSTNTASNIGFAIPSNEISSLLSQLERGSIGSTTVGSSGSEDSTGSSTSGGEGGYGYGYGGYGSGAFGSSVG